MTLKTATAGFVVSVALVAAPLASASAHDHWRHDGGGGLIFGLGAAVGALAVGIVTLPFAIIAGVTQPSPAYAPAPAYGYAPQPAYRPAPAYGYAPAPGYAPTQAYAPPPVYYRPPPVAYYPPPVAYYPPPPGYYDPNR
jgi:hypothetical protein